MVNHLAVFREKSKKFAEQAAAIVCLRVLGVPEGRIGEEDSGLVCKRKREARPDGNAKEARSKKRLVADAQQGAHLLDSAALANGDHGGADTPPKDEASN